MSTLKERSQAILDEKNAKILPENIKKDVQIFDIVGTMEERIDTSDATATAGDIAKGKTAYVNDEKITGTLYEITSGTGLSTPIYVQDGKSYNSNTLRFAYKPTSDTLIRSTGTMEVAASYTDVVEEIELTADKLMSGNTILGVEGSATSDADAIASDIVNGKTAYVNGELVTGTVSEYVANSTGGLRTTEIEVGSNNTVKLIAPKDGLIRQGGYSWATGDVVADAIGISPEKIVEGNTILGIEGTATSGSSNIQLFESKDEMLENVPDEEGMLGVVYFDNYMEIETGMSLRQVMCYPNVTLDEAVTSTNSFYDKNREFRVQVTATSATISYYSNTTHQSQSVSYTSTDGITYTSTLTENKVITFDTPIVVGTEYGTWNSMYNKFVITGGKEFEGIYEYSTKKDSEWFNSIVSWNIDGTTASTTNEQMYLPELAKCLEINKNDLPLYNALIVYAEGEYYYQESYNSHSNMWDDVNKKIYYGVRYSTTTQPTYNVYKLDLENMTYELVETLPYEFAKPTTSTNIGYTTLPYLDGKVITVYSSSTKYLSRYDGSSETSSYYDVSNVVWGNTPVLTWHRAETQLTATLENQIAEGVTVLGASGVITGDGSVFDTINWSDYTNKYKSNNTTAIIGVKDQHGNGIEILDEPTEESVMQNNYSAKVLYNTPVLDVDFYNNRLHMLKHYWVRKIYDENYDYNCTIFDLNGNQVYYLEHQPRPEFVEIDEDTIGWTTVDYTSPTSTLMGRTLKVSTGEITDVFNTGLTGIMDIIPNLYLPEYGLMCVCLKDSVDTIYITAANVNKTITFSQVSQSSTYTFDNVAYVDDNYIYVGFNGYINSVSNTFMVQVIDRATLTLAGTISPALGTGAFAYDELNNRVYATFGNKMYLLDGTTFEETFDIPKTFGGSYSLIAGKIIWVNEERYLIGNGATFKLGSQEYVTGLNYAYNNNRANPNVDNILTLSGDKVYICSHKPNVLVGTDSSNIGLESENGNVLSTHSTYMIMKSDALN